MRTSIEVHSRRATRTERRHGHAVTVDALLLQALASHRLPATR